MARIAGVNIPDHKHVAVSLTYIYGVGKTLALKLCDTVGVDPAVKISSLSETEMDSLKMKFLNYQLRATSEERSQ